MRELALFAGGGGGLYASLLLGHTPVCAVEIEPSARRMLFQRQADGIFPRFPIWDDVRTFNGHEWRGKVDLVSGGFPCQDISVAGRGGGIDGDRSGLWVEFARIIREVGPGYVFVENSPMLTSRGLGRVLGDLATMGFNAEWGVLSASDVGAPHKRERIWILAHTMCHGQQRVGSSRGFKGSVGLRSGTRSNESKTLCDATGARHVADSDGCNGHRRSSDVQVGRQWGTSQTAHDGVTGGNEWGAEPDVGRVAHGVANRVNKLRALGNGQVPRVAATAFRVLMARLHANN